MNDVVRSAKPDPWLTATSPQTAAAVRDLMINVAEHGTATGVRIPGVSIAAKTGTAQTTGDHAHAWMIAFAPATQPTIRFSFL